MDYKYWATAPKSDELAHHGIKGMRWGVRRRREQASSTVSSRKTTASERQEEKRRIKERKKAIRMQTKMADIRAKNLIKKVGYDEAYKQFINDLDIHAALSTSMRKAEREQDIQEWKMVGGASAIILGGAVAAGLAMGAAKRAGLIR